MCLPDTDRPAVAGAAIASAAQRLQIPMTEIVCALTWSSWSTADEMIEREFAGSYRGYFPKCDMSIRAEAVIAEIFDHLAIALGDRRRAVRSGAWTGGRCDG